MMPCKCNPAPCEEDVCCCEDDPPKHSLMACVIQRSRGGCVWTARTPRGDIATGTADTWAQAWLDVAEASGLP